MKFNTLWVFIVAVQLVCISVLFHSVIGTGPQDTGNTSSVESLSDPANDSFTKEYDRLVIFVIDALRADMISERSEMRFVRGLLRSDRMKGYLARAHAPTVTLPRLKALMSGGVPQFLDIITNLATTSSSSMADDSLISRLVKGGKRLVLFGDDTWLKLFPSAFSPRSDGTTSSFFTPDFIEVDMNVTRHIDDTFDPSMTNPKSSDWDVAILHYLGLDHIGHQLGPDSDRMSEKLREMDITFERVYKNVAGQDRKQGSKTLLLLLSDHGMNGAGNHGGSSFQETSAVAVYGLPASTAEKSEVGEYNGIVPLEDAFQVDIAPSLGLALGVGIPAKSLGCLMRGAFLSDEKYHKANKINMDHMKSLLASKQLEVIDNESCIPAQNELLSHLAREESTSSITMLKQTVVLFVLFSIIVVLQTSTSLLTEDFSSWSKFVIVVHTLSLGSSSAIENEHATVFHVFATAIVYLGVRFIGRTKATDVMDIMLVLCLMAVARLTRSRLEIINFSRMAGLSDPNFLNQGTSVLSPYLGFGLDPYSPILSMTGLHMIAISGIHRMNRDSLSILCATLLLISMGAIWSNFLSPNVQVAKVALYGSLLTFVLGLLPKVRNMYSKISFSMGSLIGLASLLHRPGNLPVLLACVVLIILTREFCLRISDMRVGDSLTMIYCTGWCGFFALGNSHSVSTIDISGGYVGSESYNRERVALLTTFVVYTAPILACFAGMEQYSGKTDSKATRALWFIQSQRLAFASFMTVLMQNHLFIWSVFAPRWVYEVLWTVLLAILIATFRLTSRD